MYTDTSRRSAKAILLLAIIGASTLSIVTYSIGGPVIALKASYPLIGVCITGILLVVHGIDNTPSKSQRNPIESVPLRYWKKSVWCIVALSIVFIMLTKERAAVLLLGLPLSFTLIVLQLRRKPFVPSVLAQISGIFLVSPLAKYMTAGRYFGKGDLLRHLQYTSELVQGNFISAISSPVYRFFPGLHTQTAIIAKTTNLPIYDSLLIFGIITYTVSVAVVFLLARVVTSNLHLSLTISFAVSILASILYHATYFYPQAFAVVGGLFLLYTWFKPSIQKHLSTPMTIISIILSLGLVFVHHLTFILFIPIIAFLIAPSLIEAVNNNSLSISRNGIPTPLFIPLAITGIIAISYWIGQKTFIGQFVFAITDLLSDQILAVGGGGGELHIYTIGTKLPRQSMEDALFSLLSPTGLYSIMLVSVFAFGIVVIVAHWRKYRRLATFFTVGLVGSFLVFQTPLLLSNRLGLPFSFFFAFIVGIGIHHMTLFDSSEKIGPIFATIVLVLLSTTAPISVADDLYTLNSGPDLVELHLGPETQKEFSAREYQSLRETSNFIAGQNMKVTTFWITRVGLSRFGISRSNHLVVTSNAIQTQERFFVYRNRWPQHQIFIDGSGSKVFISKEALLSVKKYENKVYTTGEVGILGNRDGNKLGGGK